MMPTKPKQKKKKKENAPDFVMTVRQALDLFKRHKDLGEKSPLAQPYFLGNKLQFTDTTPEARGRVLARLLREIIENDITDEENNHQKILKRCYFDNASVDVVKDEIHISRARCYDYQNEAITKVGLYLVQKLGRNLYLENPPIPPRLFDRDESYALILENLKICEDTAPKSVILAGSGGMGKTTLGSEIVKTWQEQTGSVFWYTIRIGLTDQLSALFFNLAYFLDQQGQSIPWLELVSKHPIAAHVRPDAGSHFKAGKETVTLL